MFAYLIDRILFAILLLAAFQVSVLSDHYLQFVSGYIESTKQQVESFERIASKYEYQDVYAMIDDFKRNSNPAIRADAEQKLFVMQEYEELQESFTLLKDGHLFERAWFMFSPSRWGALPKVLENFRPSIPLSVSDIIYSVILAFAVNFMIMWPIRALFRAIALRIKHYFIGSQ